MKILLREYNGKRYVWETAKYNYDRFIVNGDNINQGNIVSIVNDNRKNYVKCSCCGRVFRKGDPNFEVHKRSASSAETCFGCRELNVKELDSVSSRFSINPDGSFSETLKRNVRLECMKTGWFSYSGINSNEAIASCPKRQCANAREMEIKDFFTEYHGAFDDIITVDALLDKGHDVLYTGNRTHEYEFVNNASYSIYAITNSLGIIDHFYVWHNGETWDVYYSKKYDMLFYNNKGYKEWCPYEIDFDEIQEIKKEIAKLYR